MPDNRRGKYLVTASAHVSGPAELGVPLHPNIEKRMEAGKYNLLRFAFVIVMHPFFPVFKRAGFQFVFPSVLIKNNNLLF